MKENTLNVTVRMYRVGELGDCFLLRFKENGKNCNVLLDCGSFRNGEDSAKRMRLILGDIKSTLKGQQLHVVVGTHQHNDHLSGFVHGKEILGSLDLGNVWLSWLDDPQDRLAGVIRSEQDKAITQLREVGERLKKMSFAEYDAVKRMEDIMEFSTNFKKEPVVPAAAIKELKQAVKNGTKYLEPGQIVPLPQMEDLVEVFVLGPPMDREKLKDITATSSESYDHRLSRARVGAEKLMSALSNYDDSLDNWEESHFPFTDHYNITTSEFEKKKDERKDLEEVWNAYHNEEWRKIDEEWLEEAGNLALYMDRYTNNTSLVLAFRLVKTGKYLLFVGDAQTGNWNSWKDVKWKGAPERFTVNNILNNTILYKVGHHCSHNATLVQGLEAMTDPDLIAMIPVDASDANITKARGWKMPAKNLLKKLKEKTNNRILRMDEGFAQGCEPDNKEKNKWTSLSYDHKISTTDLYVEHEMNF